MKFLILITFLLSFVFADDIDVCIQQKLKLSEPVNHQTIFRDIESGNFKQFRYAARSALQICHPTFDIVAGQIFRKLTKPEVPVTDTACKCYQIYLMKSNADGLLAPQLDKNLLKDFDGSDKCDEIIDSYKQSQISQKMPEGTVGELNCMNKIIGKYMSGRIKALVLSKGEYSLGIFTDEKDRFVRELRDVSEELIECIVAL